MALLIARGTAVAVIPLGACLELPRSSTEAWGEGIHHVYAAGRDALLPPCVTGSTVADGSGLPQLLLLRDVRRTRQDALRRRLDAIGEGV